MTAMPVIRDKIVNRAAWKGSEMSKDILAFDFTPKHLAAFAELLKKIKDQGLTIDQIGREQFDHPAINADLAAVVEEVQNGRGIVLMRRLPIENWSLDDTKIVYWGIGTHFGEGVSQSVLGDRIGHVEDMTKVDPTARAYRHHKELMLHTDLTEIIGMLSIRKAPTGGMSRYASAMTIHNEMLAHHPDHLETLYKGYPYHRHGEQQPGQSPTTPHNVPLFSQKDGKLSIRYVRQFMITAARELGEPMPEPLVKALDCFDEIAQSPEVMLECMLEPGEITFINNFVVTHARTAFQDGDDPAQKRLLLRLWLDVKNGRPVVPEVEIYERDENGQGGIRAVDGKVPSFNYATLEAGDRY